MSAAQLKPISWLFFPGINNPSQANEVCKVTEAYFGEHVDLRDRAGDHLRACYEILDLIPQTEEKFGSGHFFPFAESYIELESSLVLATFGFYRHAFAALRVALELNLIGVFHDRHDQAETEIEDWLHSRQELWFGRVLSKLNEIASFETFFSVSNFKEVLKGTHKNLCGFVHVQGYPYSSSRLTSANFNRFSEDTLKGFVDVFCSVAHSLLVSILLKYPMGMQSLSITSKFGLEPPMGGFLDAGARASVMKVLEPTHQEFLLAISNADPVVQEMVNSIESLPDLSDGEWERQSKALEESESD